MVAHPPPGPSGPLRRLGRYEILRPIGRGGMAEVYLARSLGPGGVEKRVCLKRVLPGLAVEPRAARRFLDEARIALSLQQANIVPVFDFGREGQDLFLVMEWIDGCDLGRLLAGRRADAEPLPEPLIAYVGAELARALAYAHERKTEGHLAGVIHRDVTPRNVLLSRTGEVRLTDFGNASVLGASGGRSGTPRYMSPEHARGEPPTPGDDLYALGLILAEMRSGRPLRRDNTIEGAHIPVNPPEPRGGDRTSEGGLAQTIAALLAPDPAARPARATDVHAALARVLADAVVRGEPPPAAMLAQAVSAEAATSAGRSEPAVGEAPRTAAAETVDATTRTGSAPADVEAPARADRVPVARAAIPPLNPGRSPARRRALLGGGAVLLAATIAAVTVAVVGPQPSRRERPPEGSATGARARTETVMVTPAAAGSAPAPAPTPSGQTDREARWSPTPAAPRATPSAADPSVRRRAELRILAPGSWVAVYLDGRQIGHDAGVFSVPAGRHRLRVENAPLRFEQTDTIDLRAGETVTRTYRPGAGGNGAEPVPVE